MSAEADEATPHAPPRRTDPWTDLALTLPIFLVYHLGVIFLPIRNAADPLTAELNGLAKHSLPAYATLTLALGLAFIGVLSFMGRTKALDMSRFVVVAIEAGIYAVLMRGAGSYVVGSLRLANGGDDGDVFSSVIMAFGAGFYEEVAFRVLLFGGCALIFRKLFGGTRAILLAAVWAVVEAAAFSAWHHTGSLGEEFTLGPFVFRAVCGLFLTAIYAFRGFAPAVWTHAIYDLWVMILG